MRGLKYFAMMVCLASWTMTDALAQPEEGSGEDIPVIGPGFKAADTQVPGKVENRTDQNGNPGMQRDSSEKEKRAAKAKADILIESNR